jgi:adenylate cyclase
MDDAAILGAWLESPTGDRWPIQASCALGRSTTNQVVLADNKISRRHAIVHCQGDHEYWLVDLGSSNGTYLNGRRLAQPTRLRDQDRIAVGPFQLAFRQPLTAGTRSNDTLTGMTITDIKTVKCWLLIADIIGSTELSRKLSADELPMVTGRWLAACKQIVDDHGGSINKFLGDGFFAYWTEGDNTLPSVAQALTQLKELQAQSTPQFRLVLHHGPVSMGGTASMGEESLLGNEVNFVFRMEKLAGGMGAACLMSQAAQELLKPHLPVSSAGRHNLSGFTTTYDFYSF